VAPAAARKVLIPRPGSGEKRPLAVAAVRDRIVQAAVKIVLEPADFLPCSSGLPGLSNWSANGTPHDRLLIEPDRREAPLPHKGLLRPLTHQNRTLTTRPGD
jgi:hypothetical protein